MTGIKEKLIPDPYLEGGEIHELKKDGYLNIHSDLIYTQQWNWTED